jgi:hypothetical protein
MMAAVAQIWSSRRQLPPDPSSQMAAWDGARKRTFRRAAGQWSRSSAGTGLVPGQKRGTISRTAQGRRTRTWSAEIARCRMVIFQLGLARYVDLADDLVDDAVGMSSCWPRGGRAALPRPGLLAKHALVSDSIPLWPAGSTAARSTVSPVRGVRRPPGGARFARLRTRGR